MAQKPDPARELAFYHRVLVSQKCELARISKNSLPRDRSRETLVTRAAFRRTDKVIKSLRADMGKRVGGPLPSSQLGDGATAPPGRAARPPNFPPPAPPPPPPDIVVAAGIRDLAGAHKEGKRRRVEAPKQELPPVRRFLPTPIPRFNPSKPPPYTRSTPESRRRHTSRHRPKRKAPDRAYASQTPTQGRTGK